MQSCTSALEQKRGLSGEQSCADRAHVVQRTGGEVPEVLITSPKPKLSLLNPLGRTKRQSKPQEQDHGSRQEGGASKDRKSGVGGGEETQQERDTRAERMLDVLVGGQDEDGNGEVGMSEEEDESERDPEEEDDVQEGSSEEESVAEGNTKCSACNSGRSIFNCEGYGAVLHKTCA